MKDKDQQLLWEAYLTDGARRRIMDSKPDTLQVDHDCERDHPGISHDEWLDQGNYPDKTYDTLDPKTKADRPGVMSSGDKHVSTVGHRFDVERTGLLGDEGGHTKNPNDPRLLANLREEVYVHMKHQLPRRYRKGVTFFQLPKKIRRWIDAICDESMKTMKKRTEELLKRPEWIGWSLEGTPDTGTEFHPLDPSDVNAADEKFNKSLAGAAQRKPAFLDNPAIYPPKKVGNVTILPKKK